MPELSIKLSKRTHAGEGALFVWTLQGTPTRVLSWRYGRPCHSERASEWLQEFDKVGIRTLS